MQELIPSKCLICNLDNPEKSHYWVLHRVSEQNYFEKYYPKTDLFTKEKLIFKSKESYFQNDFQTKSNLQAYFRTLSGSQQRQFCKDLLQKRKIIKNLIFAPCQFELKSMLFPTLITYNSFQGGYEEICKELGLKLRYSYYSVKIPQNNKKLDIVIDTREQKPLSFSKLVSCNINTLNYGDYSLLHNPKKIVVDRKALNDYGGTISRDNERFRREIDRAKKDNGYLIVLIEEKFSNIQSIKYLPHTKHIKATSDFLLHKTRELIADYDCVQFLAVDGRKKASQVIESLFSTDLDIKHLDLQFLYDSGNL